MKKVLFILLGLFLMTKTNAQIARAHVGTSRFDLQTNNSIQRRIAVSPISKDIVVTFTGGNDFPNFERRGTGYAYFNNLTSTWYNAKNNPIALGLDTFYQAIEYDTARVGWPNPMFIGNKEVILSHMAPTGGSTGQGNNGILMVSRTNAGSGAWSIRRLPNNTKSETWPRAENSGDTIFLISSQSGQTFNDVQGGISFSYSLDGGNTWSNNDSIKGLNPSIYTAIGGDNYAVDLKNSTAAVLTGTFDVTLFKSTDLGKTWTKKSIISPAYNFLKSGDIMPFRNISDGSYSVIIDKDNVAHCFFGVQGAFAFPAGTGQNGGATYSPDPNRFGIMYWNENMGNEAPKLIPGTDFIRELNTSPRFPNTRFYTASNTLSYNGGNASYNGGSSTWPSSGIDAAGNVYLTYAYNRGIIDTTAGMNGKRIDGDPEFGYNLFDVYTMRTTDKGKTWTEPLNVSQTKNLESAYPSMAKFVDENVHIVYQEDSLSGCAFVTGTANGSGSHAGGKFIPNKTIYAKVPVTELSNTSTDITHPIIGINYKYLSHIFRTNQQERFNFEVVLFKGCTQDTISKAVFDKSKKFFIENIVEYSDNKHGSDTNYFYTIGLDTLNTNTIGNKLVRIYAKDAQGNLSLKQGSTYFDTMNLFVRVIEDNEPPSISIVGNSTIYVYLNGSYSELGYNVGDNNPCARLGVGISGSVNTSAKGSNTLTYSVTDTTSNLSAQTVRTVIVGVAPTAKITEQAVTGNKLTAKGTTSLDTLTPSNLNKFVWSYKRGNQSTIIGSNSSSLNYTIPSSLSSFDSICLELSNGFNTAVNPIKPVSKECKALKYTAGVSTISGVLSISIFPNPSNGEFSIKVEGNRENKARISITGMDGKMISTSQIEVNNQIIPLKSNLAKGSYFVSTEIDGQVHLEKIEVR